MNQKPTISELANMISEDDPRDPGAELANRKEQRWQERQPRVLEHAVVTVPGKGAGMPTGSMVLTVHLGEHQWGLHIPMDEYNAALGESTAATDEMLGSASL